MVRNNINYQYIIDFLMIILVFCIFLGLKFLGQFHFHFFLNYRRMLKFNELNYFVHLFLFEIFMVDIPLLNLRFHDL